MFTLDDRRKRAAEFLQSSTCTRLARWDADVMERWPSDIHVFGRLEWRDVSRAARAWGLLDREIRRCGRAYKLAYEASGTAG